MRIFDILREKQFFFGLRLQSDELETLEEYCKLVFLNNNFLHLIAPMPPEEFAVRHILESLMMLEFLSPNANFADIGAGAGLPSIPCLVVRKDISAVLIESNQKKSLFLLDVIKRLNLGNQAKVINKQFQEVEKPNVGFIACRALDKFTQKLPKLLKWGRGSNFLLFGGDSIRQVLKKQGIDYKEKLLPLSKQRFLFFIETSSITTAD